MDFLKDVFGSGMNIFGASAPQNTQRMIDAGLLAPDAKSKAQSQSLMRGLLGTAVSFASQPRTGNYGSWVPYAGKAFAQGMEQAQQPYDNMYDRAKQNHAMNQIAEEKLAKDNKAKFDRGLYQPNAVVNGLQLPQADPRLEKTDQAGNVTQVAPNFNPIRQTSTPAFDSGKYLKDSLDNGLITSEEYFKYKNLLNPSEEDFTLASGAKRFDSNGNVIADNPKAIDENLTTNFRDYKMTTDNPTPEGFKEYMKTKGSGVNVTNVMPGGEGGDSKYVRDELDKLFITSQNDARALNTNLNDLKQMERLMSKANKTGFGAEVVYNLQQIADRIGGDVDVEAMGATGAMRALSNKLALGMRKAGTGVMTDKDFQVFLESVPGITNPDAANKAILAWTKDSHEKQMALAEKIREYKRSDKSLYGGAKTPGVMDDAVYDLINDYWIDVNANRDHLRNIADGTDFGDPIPL